MTLRRSILRFSVALPLACFVPSAFAASDVVVALDANVIGLDPADLNDNLSMTATRTMLQGLYGFDREMKTIPVLAEGYEASPDATIYTLHLRHGITFHDGAPFNAQAVKTSFDRAADPENHLKRASLFAPIKSNEVIDDYTLRITLNAPFGAFINNLAHQAFAVSSPKAIAEFGRDLGRHPVGTGPYQLVSWSTDTLKVARNEHYWKPGLPKGQRTGWAAGNAASDLSHLTDAGTADAWVHGHVHATVDLTRPGGTRIVCNAAALGFTNSAFRDGWTVEI